MRPVPRVRGSVSSRSSMSTTPSLSTSAGPTQSHQSTRSSRHATFYIILENSLLLSTAYWRNDFHFLPAGRARPAQTCPPSTSLRTKLDCGTLSSQTRGVEADMARSSSLTRCLLRTTFMGRWHEGRGGHTFRSSFFYRICILEADIFVIFWGWHFLWQDLSSLRLLLPSAQKHLIAPPEDHLASSLAKLKVEHPPSQPDHMLKPWKIKGGTGPDKCCNQAAAVSRWTPARRRWSSARGWP